MIATEHDRPNEDRHRIAADRPADEPSPLWQRLHIQVIVAIVLGVMVGQADPALGESLRPLGDGFIRLVRMIIAPVIFLTVVTGISGIGKIGLAGRVAGKAFVYFLIVSTLALVTGMVVANLVRPGAGMHVDVAGLDTRAVASYAAKASEQSVSSFLLNVIPDTLVSAFVYGEILQVLLIAVLFGISLSLVRDRVEPLVQGLEMIATVVFELVALLMKAAPIGAFGAIAFTVGRYGIGSLYNLAGLVATFYLTAALFVCVVLGTIARLAGFSLFRLIGYLKAEMLLVLGTSSSESALPSLIRKMEQAGCDKSVVGLVVPTGYSFNLDGTNIYMTLTALFIAQALDIHVPLGQQILLLMVAMLSSKGAAGIAGAGFITLAATLSIVPTIPVAGVALILGVDRFMSECRSLTNFIGNAVATIVVARWEGALDHAALSRALTPSASVQVGERDGTASGSVEAGRS